ncbi:MAG: hypothetical protein IPJ43_21205 [Saprospiraceae bacterium]|nr:hypothetical protein [Saprospiraceae bacterium]
MAKGKLSSTEQKVLKPKVRKVSQGDIIEGKNPEEKRQNTVNQKIKAKLNSEAAALQDKIVKPKQLESGSKLRIISKIFLRRKEKRFLKY